MVTRQLNIFNSLEGSSCFLFGPRGVGKTHLIQQFLREHPSKTINIDLLKSDEFRRYLANPSLLRQEVEEQINTKKVLVVIIDEVQKVPSLLDEVHWLIENHKKKLQFILLGSSARKLKREGVNLLAGRAITLKLHPLTFEEVKISLNKALQYGTLPKPYLEGGNVQGFLRSYVETYLKEEIQQEAIVRKLEPFIRFLDLAGQFNGVAIKPAKIARQLSVAPKTVSEYFSILTDTLIARRVDAWSYSVIKQLQASPRYYFFDCGVLNALAGELSTELRIGTYRYGKLFETFIVNELIRFNDYHNLSNKFFSFRLDSGLEVDLIVSRGPNDIPRAVEIKSQAAPSKEDLSVLLRLKTYIPEAKLFCLCTTPRRYSLDGISILPWQEGVKEVLELPIICAS